MKSDEAQVKKVVEKTGEKIKEGLPKHPDIGKNTEQVTTKFVQDGFTPKDVLNMSDVQLEGLYAQAYNFYQTGRYKDAVQIFRLLMMFNPNEAKYCLGLAACYHLLKEYDNAVQIYTMLSIIETENPIPFYHMSDCYIAMNDTLSAIVSLEMALSRVRGRAEFKMLEDRASLTLDALKKEASKRLEK